MSQRRIYTTPFINKELLLKALNNLNISYIDQGNELIIENKNKVYIEEKFLYENGQFIYQYDSWHEKENKTFLASLEKEYNKVYLEQKKLIEEAKLEEERKRFEEKLRKIEEEKKDFIEKQKNEIIKRAKEKGYTVKEKKVGNKIKLILVRHNY